MYAFYEKLLYNISMISHDEKLGKVDLCHSMKF